MHKALGPSPQLTLSPTPPPNLISLASRGNHFLQSHVSQVCSCQSCWHPGREVGGPLDATQRKCICLHDRGNQALVLVVQVAQTLNVVCVPKRALCWIKLGGGLGFNDFDDS